MKTEKQRLTNLDSEFDEAQRKVRYRAIFGRDVESQLSLSFNSDDKENKIRTTNLKSPDPTAKELRLFAFIGAVAIIDLLSRSSDLNKSDPRPPFNAEYILYLLLRKEDRCIVIGDLIEGYGQILHRFNKRRADIWFCKQVAGSLFPLLRRALLRVGALVWLGRVLRRLIS